MHNNYIELITQYYPGVYVSTTGDLNDYDALVHRGGLPMPSKAELDIKRSELIKLDVWRKIQAERDRRKSGGVKVGDYWFHSDDTSRIQQMALVIFGDNLPEGIMWKTMDGSFVLMTPTLIQQIFMASASQDIAIFSAAEQHKAQMIASANPEQYDYQSSGWPDTLYTGAEI